MGTSDENIDKTRRILASFVDELLAVSDELNQTTKRLREAVVEDADRGSHGSSEETRREH